MKKILVFLVCALVSFDVNAGMVVGQGSIRAFEGTHGRPLAEVFPVNANGDPIPNEFESTPAGAYLYVALFGLTGGGGPRFEVRVSGNTDPFAAYTLDITNSQSVAIDFSTSLILETIASNGVPIMTSSLMATYVDNDGSGGINATVTHRAFPQHQTLGGFPAQVLTHTFSSAGVANSSVGPETPPLPPFYPFPSEPFTKINTQLDVANLLPGDSLVISGRTDTVVVPEPSAFALLGLVGLLVGGCQFSKMPNKSHS